MSMFCMRWTTGVACYILASPVVPECIPVRYGSSFMAVRGPTREFCDPASHLHPVGIG